MVSEDDWSLSDTHAGSLDHDKVVLDFTVVWEASDWIDGFFGQIGFGGTVVHVDLAVFGLVASTNTSDLSETSVRFSGKFLGTPSAGYTLSSVTLSDTNAIGVVVGFEDGSDSDLLFKETFGEVDFGGGVTSVNLEFDDVSFLLFEWKHLHLGVGDESNNLAVLFDLVQSSLLGRFRFSPLLLVFSESQFLGFSPVFVESSFAFIRDVLSPDGFEGSESSWSFDVSDDTDTDHWWAIDDGTWLDNFFLVEFVTLSGDFSNDVGHTGFVSDETGQVSGFRLVVI